MSKRNGTHVVDREDSRPPKRARPEYQPPHVEEIHYARQLQQFLSFRQDGVQQLRNGIASFKSFLESILYHREEESRARQISILREYLESQKPADEKNVEQPFLTQLWQAWSFAIQNNNDHLISSVSAILALLVKTLSGILDLREHGFALCRTILQGQHLKLVRHSLNAPKHKDFVISPSLRLLTEVASFDGGVLAPQIYKRREQTFDNTIIRRNLGLVKLDISEDEARRKPSIRTWTVRYMLVLFKYLHEGAIDDILKSRPICTALFQFLSDDPADLVNELLTVLEQNVLKKEEVKRSSKAAMLTTQNLERVTEVATRSGEDHAASQRAFAWLKSVCTNHGYGILRQSGWYPPGTARVEQSNDKNSAIDLGLDSLEFYDRPDEIDLRNPTLLTWALSLRAHTNERERELLLLTFQAAPELVAAYFARRELQLDPKLSNTWIGYASLMFEISNLPVPASFGEDGATIPPQTIIAIDSLLPRPLTQHILTRCFNQSNDLITFFAVRILVVAFQKLRTVVRALRERPAAERSDLWKEAADRLARRFANRAPAMKEAIAVFRRTPDDSQHTMQREAITRLLSLYYEILPMQALEEQFDISTALTKALARTEGDNIDKVDESSGLRALELEHLLSIAGKTTGMKWFNKQGGLSYTPIAILLRIHRKNNSNSQIRSLLHKVLTEGEILNGETSGPSALDALISSIDRSTDDSAVWSFLDDCIGRAFRKPVKYLDDLDEIAASLDKSAGLNYPSTLAAVVLEQAAFVSTSDQDAETKAAWLMAFIDFLHLTSDAGEVLSEISRRLKGVLKSRSELSKQELSALLHTTSQSDAPAVEDKEQLTDDQLPLVLSFDPPPQEAESHPELSRWSQKDLELAIEDRNIDALVLCLCSSQKDVRKQALLQLIKLRSQLQVASFENSSQLGLLIGELAETFEQHYLASDLPLPYLAGTFAARALLVQNQPAHCIYPKLNKFLGRGPEWRVNRLPNYWLSNTVLDMPDEDDTYWQEAQWVLDWLVDGSRTFADLEILRRGGVFERVISLWQSPGAARHKGIRDTIAQLIFRATCIEKGSDMLITRAGILSWFDMIEQEEPRVSSALRELVLRTCDQKRIQEWQGTRL